MSKIPNEIQEVIETHSLDIPTEFSAQLQAYVDALWDWNTKINLTRHTDYETFVFRDVIDSWQLAKLIHPEETVLDIGSGGGVPGIVLAIMRPDLKITLCDSTGKKAKVLQEIAAQLRLPIDVLNQRAEDILDVERFDVCTARAVGPLWKICQWLDDCWLEAGRLLATKGPNWTSERDAALEKGLMKKIDFRCVAQYETPVINARNFILKLWAKGAPEK